MTATSRVHAALACAVVLAAAAACGDSGPRRGGTVVIAAGNDLDHANPLITVDAWTNEVLRYVLFTPLLRYGPDLDYRPALAESWEMDGDTAVVFHLRDDVFWHDGARVSAYDVLFTVERARDPATGFPNAGYFAAWREGEVSDSFTVRFRLVPGGDPLAGLPFTPPVPKHLLDSIPAEAMRTAAFDRSPVGNGPFRFVSTRAGDRWVFERDEDYPEGLGGPPLLDRLVLRIIPENSAQLTELRVGEVDLALQPTPEQVGPLSERAGIRAVVAPSRQFTMVAWNGARSPLDRPDVRQALAMAIDRQAILDALRSGLGEVATGPIMPFHWSFDPELAPVPYDPERARSLLAEAGIEDRDDDGVLELPGGEEMALELKMPAGSDYRRDVAEAVRADLAALGVRATTRATEATTLFADITSPERRFDAVLVGWSGDVRLDFHDTFHSDALGGPLQFASYSNPVLDSVMGLAEAATDREAAIPLWRRVQQILRDEQPWTPLYYHTDAFLARERVRSLDADIRGVLVNVQRWWVEESPAGGDVAGQD
ncbi:MAG: ABC transporter substrate-binding protein [Gemmatimonadota bacterium]|jgi:peptide/nickel transport system substrate-binding protein